MAAPMVSNIRPMFSMLENASTRAPSFCIRACQAPQRAVRPAMPITIRASRCCSPTPTSPNTVRTRTSTATLETAVDSRAVTEEWALPYRSGIHTWKGSSPSLLPKPRKTIDISRAEVVGPSTAESPSMALSRTCPELIDRKEKAAMMRAAPKCVMAKYLHPAEVSGSSLSPQAPRKEVREIVSQASNNSSTWSATKASSTDSMKRLNREAARTVAPSLEKREYREMQAKVRAVINSTIAPSGSRRMA